MVAGQAVEIGSWNVRRTLSALRLPGTETMSLGILNIVGMVSVRACFGNLLKRTEPAFCHLLLAAGSIEIGDTNGVEDRRNSLRQDR